MLPSDIRFKTLENLVAEAAKALKAVCEERDKLLKSNGKLEAENLRLKEEVKRLSFASVRQDRLRTRLEKLSEKLARLG